MSSTNLAKQITFWMVGLSLVVVPASARANLLAHFKVYSMNGGCWVDDEDPWPSGDPERYFRLAIFDTWSSSIFQGCAGGCTDDGDPTTYDGRTLDHCGWSTGCGSWNFTDQELVKVVDNRSGAYFYFGLWDEDNDADDSLGDHWMWASGPSSGWARNNNDSPYYADNPITTICGRDVEGIGSEGNFDVNYAIWFEDTTSPVLSGTPSHWDDGVVSDWDNDTRLDLTWALASDSESGISEYRFALWDANLSSYVWYGATAPSDGSMSFCPGTSCDQSYTPVHNHLYAFQAQALNGSYPTINNVRTSYTGWEWFTVDLVSPTSVITGPSTSGWFSSAFTVGFDDADSGSGFDSSSCKWRVISDDVTTRSWTTRTCDSSVSASVGSSSYCRHQGSGTCRVSSQAFDRSGRASSIYSRYYSIDWSNDSIATLTAKTTPTGSDIPESAWTVDRDPYFAWTIGSTVSPIVDYHWQVDATPGCSGSGTGPGNTGSVSLASNTLDGGVHTFYVRPEDAAGNCGNVATRTVRVDYTPDAMLNLRALTGPGGSTIQEGAWTQDDDPLMVWNGSISMAPIVGYSYQVGLTPDCVADTLTTSVQLADLPDGMTTFHVRAIDAAGNCGPEDTYSVSVDRTPDNIVNLRALTQAGGEVIEDGVFQSDNDPLLLWNASTSTAPILGYHWDIAPLGGEVCPVDTTSTSVSLSSLPEGLTTFYLQAVDAAGNCGQTAQFVIAVDTEGAGIELVQAFTEDGGAAIGDGVWQTDTSPFLTWVPGESTSDIVGFSTSTAGSPDCVSDTAAQELGLSGLAEGVTRFSVRALDEAGNCGPVASFDIAVDTQPDRVAALWAVDDEETGVDLEDGGWQRDVDPVMFWESAPSTAPIAGYSTSIAGEPDCTVNTTEIREALESLPDGTTVFQVRVIDAADNCGDPESFAVAVDTVADDIAGLSALTEADGDTIGDGVWQQDADPLMVWDASTSTAPIAGYAVSTTGTPGCDVDGEDPSWPLVALAEGVTTFSVRAIDEAGNCGSAAQYDLAVDTQVDAIPTLLAFTEADGTPITSGVWQRDVDPLMTWSEPSSTSPIDGYSTSTTGDPDCDADTEETSELLATLADGVTAFSVRALDEAGNCGPVASFDLAVDTAVEGITNLAAFTELGGSAIGDGVWQQDTTPFMTWGVGASNAPVVGYSWGLDGAPDCAVETDVPSTGLPILPDGATTFWVRALDAAGNCGPAEPFVLAVDTEGDEVLNLRALTEADGAVIGDGAWQRDGDPLMLWDGGPSTAPLDGYSWAVDDTPSCEVNEEGTSMALTDLSDGVTLFAVRTIDEAGNCGAVATFDVAVDRLDDAIDGLTALTEEGGDLIPDGQWQTDTDPLLTWNDSSSTAPVVGYSTSTEGEPDCTVDTTDTQQALADLGEGLTTFQVRPIDAADNCGLVETYDLAVDTMGDPVENLRALTGPSGAVIDDGQWQSDDTPLVLWDASGSTSPDVGYSWSISGTPDCTVDTDLLEVAPALAGDGVTTFQVRAVDAAGNCGGVESFGLAVDTQPDAVSNLRALTEPGGSPIGDGSYQQDTSPYLSWDASTSTAPIAGYTWSIAGDPACSGGALITEAFLSDLPDGVTTFSVRAIDEALNCGPVASFDIAVDTEADAIANLHALAEADGEAIGHGVWQQDVDPLLLWDPSFAPGASSGYSWSVEGDPDCEVDTSDTELALAALDDGLTHFRVRAIDEAGNCGLVAIFTIAVDTEADDVTGLSALTDDGGTSLASGGWQQDVDPLMTWEAPVSVSPVAGYSVDTDGDPDCTVDTADIETPIGPLGDGITVFGVRAIDEAGNCGGAATFSVAVDTQSDAVTGLTAYTQAGGTVIDEGAYQSDTTPYLDWADSTSTAPIAGYSWSIDGAPDCEVDADVSHAALDTLEQGTTTFEVRAVDQAGNCGPAAPFVLAVDSQGDAVPKLTAYTELDGEVIGNGLWQTDATPVMTWDPASSVSDIAGYSWSIEGTPDCAVMTEEMAVALGPLPNGVTTFRVRALDEADNCGPVATYQLAVDTVPDLVSNLRALTEAGGSTILSGNWQPDNEPLLRWDASTSVSPITGYSFSIDGAPDCVVETTATQAMLTLADGLTTFQVRAVDQAGNCGPPADFDLAVDTQADPPLNLRALTHAGGDPIEPSVWQADSTPYLLWDAAVSDAPVVGYSWGQGESLDCIVDTDATSVAPPALADGLTTFWVRTLDQAGNCSDAAELVLAVDTTGDPVTDLRALTDVGGELIPASRWQQDNDPVMTWSIPSSDAPITGYALAVDEEPPCEAALVETQYAFGEDALGDEGQHVISVVAHDAAGNCGTPATFSIWVLAAAPEIVVEAIAPNPARIGSELAIRVQAERELQAPPEVTIGEGPTAEFTSFVAGVYTYRYSVVGALPEGLTDVVATGQDLAGNVGTGFNQVTLDFTPPGLVDGLSVDPPVATTGQVLTIGFESDEFLGLDPVVTVAADNPATLTDHLGNTYAFEYVVTGAEGEGPVEVAVDLEDLAGNTSTVVTTFTLDVTPPVVELTYPDQRLVLDLGDEVEIAWTTTDAHPYVVAVDLSRDGGQSWPERLVEDLPDRGTTTWTVAGEETTNARFRVVATDVVGLTGSDESLYDSRFRVPVADHVLTVASDSASLVGTSIPVELLVVDRLGDPVAGTFDLEVAVTGAALFSSSSLVSATPGGALVSGATAPDGTASVDVFDLVAETVRVTPTSLTLPAQVPHIGTNLIFQPQQADHMIVTVADGVANVGEEEELVVLAVDRSGNPSPSEVEARIAVDGNARFTDTTLRSAIGVGGSELFGLLRSDGTARVTLVDGIAEEVTVSASSDSLPNFEADEPASVVFLQTSDVDPLQATIVVDPPRVFADGIAYSRVTVTPRNAVGEAIGSGLDVEIFAEAGDLDQVVDEGDGTYTSRLRSNECYDDPVAVGTRIEDVLIPQGAEVTFTCDAFDSAVLVADPETIVADGETCASIAVTPLYQGEPMPSGQYVEFVASYGELTPTESAGSSYRATLCSDVCAQEPIEVTARVNGVLLTDVDSSLSIDVGVECLGVDPSASTILADPRSLPADGVSASTLTVVPIRLDELLMGSGLTVTMETSRGELTEVTDEGDGRYTARLTSTEVGEAQVTATVAGVPLDAHELVTFLDFTPPADWVLLNATYLGGELQPESSLTVAVNITNQSERILEDVTIRLTAAPGTELDASRTTFADQPVVVTFDGEAREWAIGIDRLPLTEDGGPSQLVLGIRTAPQGEDIGRYRFRAYQQSHPISAIEELDLALELNQLTAEACSCRATPSPSSVVIWLLPFGVIVWRARRRRRGRSNPG